MYAGGWAGGFLRREGGLVGFFFTGVTHEADFSYSVLVGEVRWGLLKATLSLCILHTLFFVVVNIVVSLFFFFHFKKNANIYCTLSVPF